MPFAVRYLALRHSLPHKRGNRLVTYTLLISRGQPHASFRIETVEEVPRADLASATWAGAYAGPGYVYPVYRRCLNTQRLNAAGKKRQVAALTIAFSIVAKGTTILQLGQASYGNDPCQGGDVYSTLRLSSDNFASISLPQKDGRYTPPRSTLRQANASKSKPKKGRIFRT